MLLIEDSPAEVRLVREAVADCAVPVRLSVAWDGQQALDFLADDLRTIDVIILYLNLPKVPGRLVLERDPRKEVPVVVFSSTLNPDEAQDVLKLGAREFVHKPLDLDEFTTAIRNSVGKWTAAGCTAL